MALLTRREVRRGRGATPSSMRSVQRVVAVYVTPMPSSPAGSVSMPLNV